MRSSVFRLALISSAAAVLVACSQGTPDYIEGFAATGAAMANATVKVRCAAGPAVPDTTTDSEGLFSVNIDGGQVAPCIVQVSGGGTTLHSFAGGAGRLNVTPLTELSVGKALGANPSTAFASFDSTKASTISSNLNTAKAAIKTQVQALTNDTIQGDIFTSVFTVGDPDDRVLDKLNAKLQAINRPFTELQANAATGGDLIPAVQAAARGTLIGALEPTQPVPAGVLNVAAPASLVQLTGPAQCGVEVHQIHYNTVGIVGEAATASGALLVPTGCTPNGALVAYAKGTDVDKIRSLASINDPETMLLVMMYAAQGYTVVATDYLGFAKSNYKFHPYLHADSQATTVIDSIRAARVAAQSRGVQLSGKVVVTGYSQGGHASMATQRAIEASPALSEEIDLVAGAHLAGPYNLNLALARNDPIAGYQIFVPYMLTAWQKVYGDLYASVAEVFKPAYATGIDSLLPSSTFSYTSLFTNGKLPAGMPTEARDALFQSAYLSALQASASHPVRVAGARNDLLGWTPKGMVMLCSGSRDPTVPYAIHHEAAEADLRSRVSNPANVVSINVDEDIQRIYKDTFDLSKYHGEYAPPLCAKSARQFFDSLILPPT